MSRKFCVLIYENGRVEPFRFKGAEPSLEELQRAVGGYIDLVRTPTLPGHIMVVDDEGIIKGKHLNQRATLIALRNIVGRVVVLPSELIK